jgi:hypothetical protein
LWQQVNAMLNFVLVKNSINAVAIIAIAVIIITITTNGGVYIL